jgi:hypothetical protein
MYQWTARAMKMVAPHATANTMYRVEASTSLTPNRVGTGTLKPSLLPNAAVFTNSP